jgi:Pyruvate/2-oxoacid:ferredoxin oxidoreductase delta subunit
MSWRDLITDALGEIPVADPECCVHTHAEVASCRRCIDACPRGAWLIDDEELAIDGDRCDGCGLCVAHCPEGALSQDRLSLTGRPSKGTVSLSCEFADAPRGAERVPCVNAFGLRRIARLYHGGMRRLRLRTAVCEDCPRADEKGLVHALSGLNRVLSQRGLPLVELVRVVPGRGFGTPAPDEPSSAGPQFSRRGFFRQVMGAVAEEYADSGDGACRAPGEYLPPTRQGEPALFVPCIDGTRCNGCDACVRSCQHAALSLSPDHGAYLVSADVCTGCRLCTDVCDQDAVAVREGVAVEQSILPLQQGVCQACGARFHRPLGTDLAASLCHVCAHINHYRHLFQVL